MRARAARSRRAAGTSPPTPASTSSGSRRSVARSSSTPTATSTSSSPGYMQIGSSSFGLRGDFSIGITSIHETTPTEYYYFRLAGSASVKVRAFGVTLVGLGIGFEFVFDTRVIGNDGRVPIVLKVHIEVDLWLFSISADAKFTIGYLQFPPPVWMASNGVLTERQLPHVERRRPRARPQRRRPGPPRRAQHRQRPAGHRRDRPHRAGRLGPERRDDQGDGLRAQQHLRARHLDQRQLRRRPRHRHDRPERDGPGHHQRRPRRRRHLLRRHRPHRRHHAQRQRGQRRHQRHRFGRRHRQRRRPTATSSSTRAPAR